MAKIETERDDDQFIVCNARSEQHAAELAAAVPYVDAKFERGECVANLEAERTELNSEIEKLEGRSNARARDNRVRLKLLAEDVAEIDIKIERERLSQIADDEIDMARIAGMRGAKAIEKFVAAARSLDVAAALFRNELLQWEKLLGEMKNRGLVRQSALMTRNVIQRIHANIVANTVLRSPAGNPSDKTLDFAKASRGWAHPVSPAPYGNVVPLRADASDAGDHMEEAS
jgi:hypothetical protein